VDGQIILAKTGYNECIPHPDHSRDLDFWQIDSFFYTTGLKLDIYAYFYSVGFLESLTNISTDWILRWVKTDIIETFIIPSVS
jgi:hypothetical protein